jgi:phosphonate transport system permease protein
MTLDVIAATAEPINRVSASDSSASEHSVYEFTERENGRPRRAVDATRYRNLWLALIAFLGLWSFGDALFRPELFNPGGWSLVGKFFAAVTRPEISADFIQLILDAAATTAAYALVGTALSLLIGVVGGVIASETWWRRDPLASTRVVAPVGWVASRVFGAIPRGVHEAVLGLVLLRILGLDPWVAILAIAVPYGAITAKVVAESIDDEGGAAYRAYRIAGASRVSALAYGVAPVILPDVVSYGLYRLECSIRSSVVLGMIGAGGLGYQIAVSFKSLRYEEIWTLLGALAVLAAAADWWSAMLRRRPTRRRVAWSVVVATFATIAAAIHLGVNPSTLVEDRTRTLGASFARDAWPPTLPTGGWGALWRAVVDTVQLSVIAITFATLIGVPVAYFAARAEGGHASRRRRAAAFVARQTLLFLRCVPPPIWALLVLFVVFPGPLAGGFGLGLYTLGVVGRLGAEAIENSDRVPARVLREAGVGRVPAMAYGSLPVVMPRFVSLSMYRWEVSARETVIVGLVGAGGLGRLLAEQNAAFDEAAMLTTVIALIVMSLAIDVVSARVRAAIR